MKADERTPLTLFAHTPPEGLDNWHRLDDHLRAVAELAAQFGAPFGAGDVCRVLGAAHDLGKADPRFQHYLRACQAGEGGASVPHAVAGATALRAALGPFALEMHEGQNNKAE